jgi:hypothetical protein
MGGAINHESATTARGSSGQQPPRAQDWNEDPMYGRQMVFFFVFHCTKTKHF